MKSSDAPLQERHDAIAAAVADYLRVHPDFFHHRLDLLESLHIPHPCGEAVSLVTRQLDILRERNRKLQLQINDIVQIARENDALAQRIHRLTLTLLDASSLDDALAGLRWLLHDCFDADFVAVRLLEPQIDCTIADLCMPPDTPGFERFWSTVESGRPECGRTDAEHAYSLFGSNAKEVESQAVVPLQHAGFQGLLAIGSRDPNRFGADLGYQFLTQMGEIIAARLAALIVRLP